MTAPCKEPPEGRRRREGVHSGKVRMSPDVDMERVARGTPMFSGLMGCVDQRGRHHCNPVGKEFVELQDLEEARDKIRTLRRRSRRMKNKNAKPPPTTRPDTPSSSGF